MADKTIGDLTAAGPLTGAEEMEVEQGGNSRKATVDGIGDRLTARDKAWPAGQRSAVVDLEIISGEVDWSLADGNVFAIPADADFLLNLPDDIATHVGQTGVIIVTQDGTGGWSMSVDAAILPLNSDTLFEVAQAAGAVTVVPFIVVSATQIGISGSGLGVAL